MRGTTFWVDTDYASIIGAIAGAGSRDSTSTHTTGDRTAGGSAGISQPQWNIFRGTKYQNTEMIGAMVAKLTYGKDSNFNTDYLVSAAPNVLFNTTTQTYKIILRATTRALRSTLR